MKKLLMSIVGLVVLGAASVFALDGKKIDPKIVMLEYPQSYTFNINNKSDREVSFFVVKLYADTQIVLEATEYIMPAKSTDVIEFEGVSGGEDAVTYAFAYWTEDDDIWWDNASWWSDQKEIVVDKNGYLLYKENGSSKKVVQVKRR